ncbi:hypothetical protein CR513_49438, partial [Mucuna pruriens]
MVVKALCMKLVVETPQQNGSVERRHQSILNIARALILQSTLLKYIWSYAIQCVVFLLNQLPSKVLNEKSHYQVLHGDLPNLDSSHTGYKPGVKGYVAYDVYSKEIVVLRYCFP